ncbi:ectonucleotide pyrophosphatase/phosphodiesterase [Pseudofulvimonas gallinarii]|jgi:predicted AlkP superfamily pyrophosphatase or phosphodiesterase|uniref:Putative AlkP superfamily pyrophosphatase or phosphodiesterase n=1 Tax=Pseudofulvimonas gallinarii TaxID=634155 RepID=A0A4R3LNW2_9GAMM|nr:ectonucleotide pyrophosphatase/phosphodiesterase [Pseudofulvimonas gallinarii]TCT01386.1 putative AlkP superfamily pyrophosphatase or phosphodiesterase [Pseudofulvimonas gallinarii]THD15138.1 hypothetical protein B1808_01750 [Pseudofulvimonas gallinarii]
MRRLIRYTVVSLFACLLMACGVQPTASDDAGGSRQPIVLLVSIDGFHPDYLDRGLTPTLQALADGGVRARWMTPSFPSKTFPNHYTLVTGLVPDRHGILDNAMVDDGIGRFSIRDPSAVGDSRWWQGEPVWVTAKRAGLRTSVMFWPGSEAEISGVRPDDWAAYDLTFSAGDRVDRVLAWLDRPLRRRPHLILTYFEEVDITGHRYGPDSTQVNEALVHTDAALARLVEGLRRRGLEDAVDIVIVSDHGMAALLPDRELFLEDLVDPAKISIVALGEITSLRSRPGHEQEVAAALLRRRSGINCHARGQMPAEWRFGRHPRVPEFVCVLDEGWRIRRRGSFSPWEKAAGENRGGHGYEPSLPSMRALFIAHGPSFGQGLLVEPFQNIHVQPLLLRLLGIEGPETDGDPAVTAPLLRAVPPGNAIDQKSVQP